MTTEDKNKNKNKNKTLGQVVRDIWLNDPETTWEVIADAVVAAHEAAKPPFPSVDLILQTYLGNRYLGDGHAAKKVRELFTDTSMSSSRSMPTVETTEKFLMGACGSSSFATPQFYNSLAREVCSFFANAAAPDVSKELDEVKSALRDEHEAFMDMCVVVGERNKELDAAKAKIEQLKFELNVANDNARKNRAGLASAYGGTDTTPPYTWAATGTQYSDRNAYIESWVSRAIAAEAELSQLKSDIAEFSRVLGIGEDAK